MRGQEKFRLEQRKCVAGSGGGDGSQGIFSHGLTVAVGQDLGVDLFLTKEVPCYRATAADRLGPINSCECRNRKAAT
jgi:hypothetical protein